MTVRFRTVKPAPELTETVPESELVRFGSVTNPPWMLTVPLFAMEVLVEWMCPDAKLKASAAPFSTVTFPVPRDPVVPPSPI